MEAKRRADEAQAAINNKQEALVAAASQADALWRAEAAEVEAAALAEAAAHERALEITEAEVARARALADAEAALGDDRLTRARAKAEALRAAAAEAEAEEAALLGELEASHAALAMAKKEEGRLAKIRARSPSPSRIRERAADGTALLGPWAPRPGDDDYDPGESAVGQAMAVLAICRLQRAVRYPYLFFFVLMSQIEFSYLPFF